MKKLWLLLISISSLLLFSSTCFGVADDYYVTTTGAGDKSGTEWAKAFDWAAFETDCEANAEAGDRYFFEAGTYTLTQELDCQNDGTQANYIELIGVKSGTTAEPPTTSDWAYGSDRPDIDEDGNGFQFDDYWMLRNFDITGTSATVCTLGSHNIVDNCKFNNTSGTAGRKALGHWVYTLWVLNSEIQCANGIGVSLNGGMLFNTYVHDCDDECLVISNDNTYILNSVLETCTEDAIESGNDEDKTVIVNSVLYNSAYGIDMDDASMNLIYNNIIDGNTTQGCDHSAGNSAIMMDYNVWDNTSDTNNCTKGPNAVTGDPSMNDPANADFTLSSSSSNATDAGAKLNTTVHEGIATNCKYNIGVDQDDNAAGAAARRFWMVDNPNQVEMMDRINKQILRDWK